jgi:hypothetical protein
MTVKGFVNHLKVMIRYVTDIPFPGADPLTNQQVQMMSALGF